MFSEQSESPADDPFGGRNPTNEERRMGRPWDESYHHGPAPWDIGGPQPAIVRIAAEGGFTGAFWTPAAGPARTHFTSPRWGCPSSALTWQRRR